MTTQSFYKLNENKWAWSQKAIRRYNEGFQRTAPFHNLQKNNEQLVGDLLTEDTPEQEIYKLIHLDRYLIEKRNAELASIRDVIKEEENKLAVQSNHLNQLKQRLRKKAYKNYQTVKSVIEELRNIETNLPFEPLKKWDQIKIAQAKVDVVKANFIGQYTALQQQYNTKMAELKKMIDFINATLSLQIQYDVLDELSEKWYFNELSYYKTQQYLIPKNFNRDIARLNGKLDHFRLYVEEKLKQQMTYVEDEISIALKIVKNDYRELQIQKRLVKAEMDKQEKTVLSLQEDLQKALVDRENDLDQSNQLLRFLTEEFVEESQRLKEQLFHPDTPSAERWVIHQYWNELAYHAKEIISYVAKNNATI